MKKENSIRQHQKQNTIIPCGIIRNSTRPPLDRIDEVERAKNRTKSTVRSKVEHVFAVMNLKFGSVKLHYRGLKKNATQLFAVCALVNLYLLRKKLLLLAPA